MSHEMMFITVVDKLVNQVIIFKNRGLMGFLRCALLVSKVWIAGEDRRPRGGNPRYPQVILEVGAIRLGGLP